MQTHQVELDLLYEQLQANEYEISGELAHYKALFDLGPVAYLVVANDGRIIDSNQAAAALFGLSPEHLTEQAVSELLAPASHAALSGMFQKLLTPGSRASCVADLPANDRTGPARQLAINATCDPRGESLLIVLCPMPDPLAPGR
nr:PAS domain-containing protein [Marinobacter sediminum]